MTDANLIPAQLLKRITSGERISKMSSALRSAQNSLRPGAKALLSVPAKQRRSLTSLDFYSVCGNNSRSSGEYFGQPGRISIP